jgi:hypothetical protein
MEPATVYNAFNPVEAELIRSRLEASGFHAFITHGLAALSMEGYSLANGGILVQVPDHERADALLLIRSAGDDAAEA